MWLLYSSNNFSHFALASPAVGNFFEVFNSCDRNPSCALSVEKLLEKRFQAAIELRKSLGLPSVSTNAYRLINSEGDRYSLDEFIMKRVVCHYCDCDQIVY